MKIHGPPSRSFEKITNKKCIIAAGAADTKPEKSSYKT